MSPEQALSICRLVKGAFPATTMDEYTPDAWALALEDDRYEDAQLAIKQLMREKTFLHVSDVTQRITKIRNDRIRDFGLLPTPPSEFADDPTAELAWHRSLLKRIADGEDVPKPVAIEASPEHLARLDALLKDGIGKTVPGDAKAGAELARAAMGGA